MKLIFLGPPGVGKGTQANNICKQFNILHLSTGDILRAEIDKGSEIGLKAKSFMDKGDLVPDNVLLDIVSNSLQKNDAQNGYLLDGFPRTIPQADGLNRIMKNINQSIDAVISLIADENELVKRLINRSKESGRSDDNPEIIRQRQKTYWKQTAPLLDYYKKTGILKSINGIGEISEITKKIIKALM